LVASGLEAVRNIRTITLWTLYDLRPVDVGADGVQRDTGLGNLFLGCKKCGDENGRHPEIAESAGVSLQLSGHTHLGQFVPWSWMARRIYRQFVYGLSRIGKMQVFTSSGAGTWGPPLRPGSNPGIVMLEFQ
jgi:hypothetical protein